MGYADVWAMTGSISLGGRLAAAASKERAAGAVLDEQDAEVWARKYRYELASAPGWDDAWASALAAGNDDPGADEAVVTDAMILSQVQAVIAAVAA